MFSLTSFSEILSMTVIESMLNKQSNIIPFSIDTILHKLELERLDEVNSQDSVSI